MTVAAPRPKIGILPTVIKLIRGVKEFSKVERCPGQDSEVQSSTAAMARILTPKLCMRRLFLPMAEEFYFALCIKCNLTIYACLKK